MFERYEIKYVGQKPCLFLYINTDFDFSKEFLYAKKAPKKQDIYDHIVSFIKKNKIKLKSNKIYLVIGGIVITTILMSNIINAATITKDDFQYVQYNKSQWSYNINQDSLEKETKETDIVVDNPKQEETIKETKKEAAIPEIKTETKQKIPATSPPKTTTPTTPKEAPKETPKEPQQEIIKEEPKEATVSLYRYNGTIEQISLEDYVTGVVSAEMPALFHGEALKAQSVAARTYALKRIHEGKVLTDTNSHQIYKDNNQLKAQWGGNFNTYYNKIKNLVASTKGQYLAFNGYYIDALYHSTSNGKTEDPINVWGGSFPYLKSVNSPWDLNANTYAREVSKTFNEASSILGFNFNYDTKVQTVSKTTGDRVKEIIIGEKSYSGVQIRTLFGLRSADFDISVTNNNITFKTRGYGHGVGMSQYGANGMGKEGYTYRQILNHYYPYTSIITK
ncbi:MAG: stage II sporulation protein D [Bacilli bacterium]